MLADCILQPERRLGTRSEAATRPTPGRVDTAKRKWILPPKGRLFDSVSFTLAPQRRRVDAEAGSGLLERGAVGQDLLDVRALDLFER